MAARAMNGLVCPDRQSGHRPPQLHLGRRLHVPAHGRPPWWNRLPSDRPRAGRFVARARPGQRPTNAAALASTPSKGSLAGCYFKLSARVPMPQCESCTIPNGSNGSSLSLVGGPMHNPSGGAESPSPYEETPVSSTGQALHNLSREQEYSFPGAQCPLSLWRPLRNPFPLDGGRSEWA